MCFLITVMEDISTLRVYFTAVSINEIVLLRNIFPFPSETVLLSEKLTQIFSGPDSPIGVSETLLLKHLRKRWVTVLVPGPMQPIWETRMEFLALALVWPGLDYCKYLWIETAYERALSHFFLLPSLCFWRKRNCMGLAQYPSGWSPCFALPGSYMGTDLYPDCSTSHPGNSLPVAWESGWGWPRALVCCTH